MRDFQRKRASSSEPVIAPRKRGGALRRDRIEPEADRDRLTRMRAEGVRESSAMNEPSMALSQAPATVRDGLATRRRSLTRVPSRRRQRRVTGVLDSVRWLRHGTLLCVARPDQLSRDCSRGDEPVVFAADLNPRSLDYERTSSAGHHEPCPRLAEARLDDPFADRDGAKGHHSERPLGNAELAR
jgi:hypothetical protein